MFPLSTFIATKNESKDLQTITDGNILGRLQASSFFYTP